MNVVTRILTALSFVLAVACSAMLYFVPFYSSGHTLIQVSGRMVLIALAVPVLASLAPVLFARFAVRVGSAAILGLFALLGGFSIGMFYIPSAVLLIAASLADLLARRRS